MVVGRDEYTWSDLRKDLALFSPLTWYQGRDLLSRLEAEAQGGNSHVPPPYDLLQPLTVLFDPNANHTKRGEALRRLVLHVPDQRDGK